MDILRTLLGLQIFCRYSVSEVVFKFCDGSLIIFLPQFDVPNCIIQESYYTVKNNSMNEYGTACLISNSFKAEDVILDNNGRIISFNINGVSITNVYPNAGSDAINRAARETIFAETIPNMLINRKQSGILLGDLN